MCPPPKVHPRPRPPPKVAGRWPVYSSLPSAAQVSPHHKGQRLTFNGWWQSGWVPGAADDLEAALSDDERRRALTHTQLQATTHVSE